MRSPRQPTSDSAVVRIDGRQIRIRVTGSGPALLLLNGWTRPVQSWEPFTEAIVGRTVIAFDAPGSGGSTTPALPMSIPLLAGLAAAVLDEVGVGTADVLGFSFGGATAQQFAVDHPARTRRLVLVSTSCGLGATPGSRPPVRSLRPARDGDRWPRPDPVGSLWHFLAFSCWSSIPFLGAIAAPTLVVCGAHDRVVPPANSVVLAGRIPGAELVIVPAGHDLQSRGPVRLLLDAVAPFLTAGDGSPSADTPGPQLVHV